MDIREKCCSICAGILFLCLGLWYAYSNTSESFPVFLGIFVVVIAGFITVVSYKGVLSHRN